jgi:Zn-dependent M28 family amino/carboxypeptidase
VFVAGGREVANIEVERPGTSEERPITLIGAHYDSAGDSPGANDNASGVAVLLELARVAARESPSRTTVRFVAFVNEEPPHFMTDTMGSVVYANAAARRGDRIAAMISLETLGYFSDAPGSQQYPRPFGLLFPDRGNFVAMVSNLRSAALLRKVRGAFRSATSLPVIASPAPERIPGVGWSDHWAFWQHGVPAVMFTDTAPFRYPHYHTREDTPDKINYDRLARVVTGCIGVLRALS